MSKLLPLLIKKIAEGDFGVYPAQVYWFLAGKKLYISAGIALIALGLDYLFGHNLCEPCGDYKNDLLIFAAFLASIGLYDGALRADKPENKDA